jgi:ketosteroid isomerase-like protein
LDFSEIFMSAARRSLFSLVVVVAVFGIAALQGCAKKSVPESTLAETVAQLTRQSDDWDKAIVRKDKAAIADNMAEDFREIDAAGGVSDKASFVRDLTSDDITIDPYGVEDFNVRVYGDVALLSGHTHMTGHEGGKAFVTHYRYIDIYRRVDGRWKVCSVQTTKIPA